MSCLGDSILQRALLCLPESILSKAELPISKGDEKIDDTPTHTDCQVLKAHGLFRVLHAEPCLPNIKLFTSKGKP